MPCSAHSCAAAWVRGAYTELGRAVDAQQGEALVAGDRGRADDLAAGALLDHLPCRLGVAEEDAAAVDGVNPVVLLRGDVQQCFGLRDARVGDEDVEGTELFGGVHDQLPDRIMIRHIAGQGNPIVLPSASMPLRVTSSSSFIDGRSETATSWPSWARRRAMAFPMPRAAPVTCATVIVILL